MAGLAETAKLLVSLDLKDNLSKGVRNAEKSLGGLQSKVGKIGKGLAIGLGAAGVAVAGGLAVGVKNGIASLEQLESATTSVQAALDNAGMAGQVTAGQVATWANEIEANVGAAFDDKDIIAATGSLIRYGKVTTENLRPAMEVITDLAAKTGSVESAATLLGKALADPEKAAGKLARQGIILTKQQQEQIKVMVKAGDAAGAQAFLLRELEKTTKGAALASQGPYKRAMMTLADVTEDVQRALAEGFLPVLERVAKWLSTQLAKPAVIESIRGLGKSLAGMFDKAVTFAQDLPWGAIADAFRIMGTGAKAAFDLFTGLPPWVQTAVVTGWGLNKISGGALGGALGGLGAGLGKSIASALGGSLFQRGGTPAAPLFTKEVGLGGTGGGTGGGMSGKFIAGTAASAAVLVTALVATWEGAILPKLQQSGKANFEATQKLLKTGSLAELEKSLAGLREMPSKLDPLHKVLYDLNAAGLKTHTESLEAAIRDEIASRKAKQQAEEAKGTANIDRGVGGNFLLQLPGAADVIARAINTGHAPTDREVIATLRNNAARSRETADTTRKAAAAQAIQASAQRILTSIANAQLATIAAKSTTPIVNVSTGFNVAISVRDTVVKTAVRRSYGTIASGSRRGVS